MGESRVISVVTLVSDPQALALVPSLVNKIGRLLRAKPTVLSDYEAVAFEVEELHERQEQAVRAMVAERPVDVAVTGSDNRKKRILVCDMDSTVVTTECIDELAELLGIRAEVAAITERTMNGELGFTQSVQARVKLLAGLDEAAIERLLAERIHLVSGARTLVRTMQAAGAYTALVSGGFTCFTGPIAARAGFEEHRANRLEIADGRLTGNLLPPILDAEAKLAAMDEFVTRFAATRDDVLAAGDGANDIPMIEAAGLGVGFRPHRKVAKAARIIVRHGDLSALLFIQGYARSDFMT